MLRSSQLKAVTTAKFSGTNDLLNLLYWCFSVQCELGKCPHFADKETEAWREYVSHAKVAQLVSSRV